MKRTNNAAAAADPALWDDPLNVISSPELSTFTVLSVKACTSWNAVPTRNATHSAP